MGAEATEFERAVAFHRAGNLAQAEALYRSLLRAKPEHLEALYNRGIVLARLRRPAEALASFDAVLALRPDFAQAHCDRGATLFSLARREEALASYDCALQIDRRNVAAHYNRGVVLLALKRFAEAARSCAAALALAPDLAAAWNNHGSALIQLKRYGEALASLDRALALQPDFAEARCNRASAMADLGRHDEACRDFACALALDPTLPCVEALLLHSSMHCCDWQSFEERGRRLVAGVRGQRPVSDPLTLLAISDSAADQLRCARTWIRDTCPPLPAPLWQGERYEHERIRVAYLSADLREHPVAHLAAELFERHDRSRFETVAVSFGAAAPSPMRSRLQRAFEHFLDVRPESDLEVARRLRALEIDIAVDLTGITAEARTAILALRPAPVQVNFLGYPATMGAGYIDYLIADRYVIPEARRADYAEQVVYLPDSFQPNDATRRVGPVPARATLGLPEEGFVFCSFNSSYKFTPRMFAVWMRLLQRVAGSVLWLVGGTAVETNLRREVAAHGVDPARLRFAPRLAYAGHLARCAAADLFLDTLPFNAGATASDALWAGLPVLTCSGEAFAARMAGSLLHAAGLPELVTSTLADYEARAVELAQDPRQLAALRARLSRHRLTAPLFDSDRFRRHLEAAYVAMWQRARRGEPAAAFTVPPSPAVSPSR